jgi:hypothetical protein
VILRPPLEVCLDRASSRTERPLSDPRVVEQLWRGFVDLEDLERFVIDNGEQSAEKTVDEILRRGELAPDESSR